MQVKLLWRSVKTVLLIPKGSDAGKYSITTGIEKLNILTVCCFTQAPKERVECNIFTYLYALTAQKLNVFWTHILMCPFNLNPGDITGDFKLVWRRYAVATVYCHDTTYCHSVFSLQQTSFHLTPLWKRLFLVAFLILTMLHCVLSECELKQAFDVLWNTISDLHGRRWDAVSLLTVWRAKTKTTVKWGGCSWVQSGQEQPSPLIILRRHGRTSKYYAWARAVNGRQFRRDSACFPLIHRVLVGRPNKPM